MKTLIKGGLAVLAAFLAFTALARISVPALLGVNVFTAAVIVYAVEEGEIPGALAGAASGLIVDVFSYGLFGLAGLVKTATGFLAGFVSRKINVQPPGRLFVFAFVLAALDLGLWVLLAALISSEGIPWAGGWLFFQPVGTAALATSAHVVLRMIGDRRGR